MLRLYVRAARAGFSRPWDSVLPRKYEEIAG
jgi:hypothetical protein